MKIYIVEESGFCFGVKRALNIIYGLNEEKQDIQIYGQLIHNRTALDELKAKGIETVNGFIKQGNCQRITGCRAVHVAACSLERSKGVCG